VNPAATSDEISPTVQEGALLGEVIVEVELEHLRELVQ
jgi:hypothetical protein